MSDDSADNIPIAVDGRPAIRAPQPPPESTEKDELSTREMLKLDNDERAIIDHERNYRILNERIADLRSELDRIRGEVEVLRPFETRCSELQQAMRFWEFPQVLSGVLFIAGGALISHYAGADKPDILAPGTGKGIAWTLMLIGLIFLIYGYWVRRTPGSKARSRTLSVG